MTHFLCATCGTQHADSAGSPPDACAICEDDRQYVPEGGQRWTTLDELRTQHRPDIREEEPGLTGVGVTPEFAIGQRALLVESAAGNVLSSGAERRASSGLGSRCCVSAATSRVRRCCIGPTAPTDAARY